MQKIYLVSEINFSKGLGHIIRLNNLASYFKNQKNIFFLLKKKNVIKNNILDYPYIEFNEKNITKLLNEKDSIFILDIAEINKKFQLFFEKISRSNIIIIIFYKKINFIRYDYLIIPYITKEPYKSNKIISGSDSLIFDKKILKQNKEKKNKKYILYINMGASDKENYTLKVLKNLKYFYNNKNFIIKILQGPFYNFEQKKKLRIISKHVKNIEILTNQKEYIKNMKNISFAIINSGNIKYEIAKFGKPFILISNDKISTRFCNYFENYIYCMKFKNFKLPNETFFKKSILKTYNSNKTRNRFKKNIFKISSKKIEKLCINLQK